jgi:RNA polymerase sigma-70 factor (ECF subfamily)
MAAAQDGDRACYAALLRELAPVLRGYARRRLPSDADAEDAVQDTLLTIHRVRATYDPARPFGPWLFALARRRVADRLSALRRSGARETLDAAVEETFDPDAQNKIEAAAEARALRAAVAALPAGQRQAIELLKLKEMSLVEVSALTGQSVTALKVATHRALATMRRRFGVRGGRD